MHPHADASAARKLELADVMRLHGQAFAEQQRLSGAQRKALRAIARCRTAELGGQLIECQACGAAQYRYHSCRNRHCPKCGTLAKERWLAARRAELLPVPYFHLVFTLPHELSALVQGNPRALYGLLFAAASKTLLEFGRNARWLGGEIAATLLLHTWSQQLTHHPHVHALVAGGALSGDGRWVAPRRGFLFPVQALAKVFRGKFLDALAQLLRKGRLKLAGSTAGLGQAAAQQQLLRTLRAQDWVVYAKGLITGPQRALDYLARYTHKSAISNERLRTMDASSISFAWRDRAHGNRPRLMHLPIEAFLARFALHVLPSGFTRIRHYGLLANRHKTARMAQAAAALAVAPFVATPPETVREFCLRVWRFDPALCVECRSARLRVTQLAPAHRPRAPP